MKYTTLYSVLLKKIFRKLKLKKELQWSSDVAWWQVERQLHQLMNVMWTAT